MKKTLSIFIFLIFICSLKSQSGFIKSYDINEGAYFLKMLFVEDTLVTVGLTIDSIGRRGITFNKIDTLGNIILSQNIFSGTDSDLHTGFFDTESPGFIKLKDNSGYIIIGGLFQGSDGFVFKVDNHGDLVWEKVYDDPNSRVDYYVEVIETESGFLVGGRKQMQNYDGNIFIMKIDKQGNKQWEKYYGYPTVNDVLLGMLHNDSNDFVISMGKSKGTTWQNSTTNSGIFAIDSLGNKKWETNTNFSLEEIGVRNLHKTKDGHWAYHTSKTDHLSDGTLLGQPKFVLRDSNFNLIREKLYSPIFYLNKFYDMIPIKSGGWLAVGGVPKNQRLAGWLNRIDKDGDVIWSQGISGIQEDSLNQQLFSVVELPSGSIIAAGRVKNNWINKSYAWMVKTDKNGCIDTLNCQPISTSIEVIDSKSETVVFPNPAIDKVTFSFSLGKNIQSLTIFDSKGSVVCRQKIEEAQNHFVWDSFEMDSGLYFYQILTESQSIKTGKVILIK